MVYNGKIYNVCTANHAEQCYLGITIKQERANHIDFSPSSTQTYLDDVNAMAPLDFFFFNILYLIIEYTQPKDYSLYTHFPVSIQIVLIQFKTFQRHTDRSRSSSSGVRLRRTFLSKIYGRYSSFYVLCERGL